MTRTDGMEILVPVDDSEPARNALEYACSTFPDSTILLLTVTEPAAPDPYTSMTSGESSESEVESQREQSESEALFDELVSTAEDYDVTVETDDRTGDVVETIVTVAETADVDQVVIGSHGRTGTSRLVLGSTAEHVVRQLDIPVTVVP